MEIYDISQELMGCDVYSEDKRPEKELVSNIKQGDLYNLTNISMCAHNGTHIDAPFHFIKNGKTVDEIDLKKFIGPCYVYAHDGEVVAEDVEALIKLNKNICPERILIKGNATITADAARIFASNKIYLLGNESQTVGPEKSPMEVHKILLEKNIVLLEGVKLAGIEQGEYFLSAAPINIAGSDGSPCRAVLIKF